MRRARAIVALGAAAALLCVAATGSARAPHRAAKPVLTIGLAAAPASLDPARDGTGATLLHELSYAPLTVQEPDGPVIGALALSYHYLGSGNRRFELTLRRNARFSDGTLVTARAVKGWLEYFARAGGPLSREIGPIESIATIGHWTVRLRLRSPNPDLPRDLSQIYDWGFVSSPRALRTPSVLATSTAGAGPYVLVPRRSLTGDHYTFVPNRYYYDKQAIRFRRVVVRVIRAPSEMLRALFSGAVEVAQGDATSAAEAAFAGFHVLHYRSNWNGLVFLARGKRRATPLGDVRVRRALNYAIDRNTISELAIGPDVGAYGAPSTLQSFSWGEPSSEIATLDGFDPGLRDFYRYDPGKARRLLASAGYPHGFTLRVASLAAHTSDKVLMNNLVLELAKVGVTVEVTRFPSPTALAAAASGGGVSAIQASQDAGTMWRFYLANVGSRSALNPSGTGDPALAALWHRARALPASAAAGRWRSLSAGLTRTAWDLPVYVADSIYYVSRRIGGVAASEISGAPNPTTWFPTGRSQPSGSYRTTLIR